MNLIYGTGEVFFQGKNVNDSVGVLAEWENTLTKMAKWKFNTIRVAVNPSILDNYGVLLMQVMNKIVTHDMKIIIDLHNFTGDDQYFGSPQWIQRWQQITTTYKGNPNIVAFELFNEPFITSTWYPDLVKDWPDIFKVYALCTDAIRTIDPSRTIIWGDPLQSNILPSDNGFLGWFGHVIETYAGYADNMYFAFHAYPPILTPPDKPWQGLHWTFKAIDYVTSKGFNAWFGEFGPLAGFSDIENRSFVLQCINYCVNKNIGFALWEYRVDHYTTTGLYDDVLTLSIYERRGSFGRRVFLRHHRSHGSRDKYMRHTLYVGN